MMRLAALTVAFLILSACDITNNPTENECLSRGWVVAKYKNGSIWRGPVVLEICMYNLLQEYEKQ